MALVANVALPALPRSITARASSALVTRSSRAPAATAPPSPQWRTSSPPPLRPPHAPGPCAPAAAAGASRSFMHSLYTSSMVMSTVTRQSARAAARSKSAPTVRGTSPRSEGAAPPSIVYVLPEAV